MVGETGFEPATLWSQTRCATKLRYSPSRRSTKENRSDLQAKITENLKFMRKKMVILTFNAKNVFFILNLMLFYENCHWQKARENYVGRSAQAGT